MSEQPRIVLSEREYLDKVYGCWLGKSIGGTLGGPYEGQKRVLNLTFYDPVPKEPLPNDDLDLQLVWLHALQTRGIDIDAQDLAQEWLDHVIYPFCEYGYSQTNLRKGLRPPVSGRYNNWFINCMGAPIRSEIWAAIAPGAPHIAAEYAYNDAIVDHAEEGVYGEVFLAAVESAAFIESDPRKLLDIGLAFIPRDCCISRAVRMAIELYDAGIDWLTCRKRILEHFGHYDMTNAPQNLAFITMGWLYGRDYGDMLCKAVNCGYDTDCTGATLGSILGILWGASSIPDEWRKPVGEEIIAGWGIVNFDYPTSIADLTQQTYEIARMVLRARCPHITIASEADESDLSAKECIQWVQPERIHELLQRSWWMDERKLRDFIVTIDYQGMPTITYERPKTVRIQLTNRSSRDAEGQLMVQPPAGWQLETSPETTFTLAPHQSTHFEFTFTAPESDVQLRTSNWVHCEIIGRKRTTTTAFDFALIGEPIWFIAGPFQEAPMDLDAALPPEELLDADGKITNPTAHGFQRVTIPENETHIEEWFNGKPGVVYAYTAIHCPDDRMVKLGAICNDGVKVWVNGEVVINQHEHVDTAPMQHGAPAGLRTHVQLHAGWNYILIKVLRCEQPVYLNFFIVDTHENRSHGFVDLENTYLPEHAP